MSSGKVHISQSVIFTLIDHQYNGNKDKNKLKASNKNFMKNVLSMAHASPM